MKCFVSLVCVLVLGVWPTMGYPYPYPYQPVAEPSREMMPPQPMPGPMLFTMPQRRSYANSLERYQQNFYSFLLKLVEEGGSLTVSIGKPESTDYESQDNPDGEQGEDEETTTMTADASEEEEEPSSSTMSTSKLANAKTSTSKVQDDGDSASGESNTTDDFITRTDKPEDETTASSSIEIQDSNVVSRLMEPPQPNDSLKDTDIPVWL